MARDNKSLGKFLLAGIPVAPRGVPQIEVTFEIDVNGILQVAAEDKGTGRQQSIKITNTGGLNSNEVERMRQEAEEYAELDRQRIQIIELKNQADNLLYNYQLTLKEHGHLIRSELQARIQQQQEQLKAAFNSRNANLEEMKNSLEFLRQSLLEVGTDVYRNNNSELEQPFEAILDDDGTIANVLTQIDIDAPRQEDDRDSTASLTENATLANDTNFDDDVTMIDDYEVVD
jgi:molecular chaperone DnaK